MEYDLPWTEKYRPKTLSEIVGQKDIVERLKVYAERKSMPNLLFAGGAGIGKTTCVLALAREIFGDEGLQYNFLELNASDTRGIDVVRNTIKDFARTKPFGDASFNIIFLDECDSLTTEAQQALRRTMEKYSKTSRFFMSCNFSSKILEPIQSRCAIFRFKPLTDEDIKGRLKYISQQEGLKIDDKALELVCYFSEGDLRKAENILEAASTSNEINPSVVYNIIGKARPEEIRGMIDTAMAGRFIDARNILYNLMTEYALAGEDILIQVYKEVIAMNMDDRLKVKLIDRIGEYNFRMVEGADPSIQLSALLAYFGVAGKEK